MQLSSVVFYGRSGQQALAMFNLEGDLEQWRDARVLDCPGGPGSLAARLRGLVGEVVAVDPLYALPEEELEQRALADLERTMAGLHGSATLRPDFDLEACREEHLQALQAFLEDRRRHPEDYRNASLPELPFPDQSFDLVLSGHLLFAYAPLRDGGLSSSDAFDLAWHRLALSELCRVSRRAVRLYPAHTIERLARRHPYATALLAELPAGWRGTFCSSRYDQGHDGCTDALQLERIGVVERRFSAAESGSP
jgi:SAM-dependent methyltransferase